MKYIVSILMLLCVIEVSACDICGCSTSASYFGIFPNVRKHFVGTRYQYNRYHSIHPADNTFGDDYFQTFEIWTRLVLHKNIQFFAVLPFQNTLRNESEELINVRGLGDASMKVNYILLDQGRMVDQNWKHFIQAGMGIKIPTGLSDLKQNKHTLPNAIQLGSGSTDYLLNALYILRYKKAGLYLDLNYTFNTANSEKYQRGNSINTSSKLFYWFQFKTMSIVPSFGVDFEQSAVDLQNQKEVEYTGRTSVLGNLGANLFFNRFSISIQSRKPIYQYLNQGLTTQEMGGAVQVNYFF